MKKETTLTGLFGVALLGLGTSAYADFTLTNGNLAIFRVGDGTAALSSGGAAVFVDEYTTTGTLVQSIAMPTITVGSNHALISSGTATSEGYMTRSSDGKSLVLSGYDAAVGTASVKSVANRTIGVLVNGKIDTTTSGALTAAGDNMRSVAYDGGAGFWYTHDTGTEYALYGSTGTHTTLTTQNSRVVSVFNNQLYISSGSGSFKGVDSVGTGKPTTTGQTLTLGPGSTSPYGFQFLDESSTVAGMDTLYLADDSANASGGGVKKFTFDGTTWTLRGTVVAGAATTDRGLTAVDNGSGGVNLYVTTGTGLYSIVDNSGFGGTLSAAATLLASAGTNQVFRGVAFTPVPEPTSLGLSGLVASGLLARRRRTKKA
jgi:hypothetical protein